MHKHKLDEKPSIIFLLKGSPRKHRRKTWISKFSTFQILILVMLNQFLWLRFCHGKCNVFAFNHAKSANKILCVCVLVTQSCPTLCDLMDCSPPGSSLSLQFSRQENWSGLPFPSPRDLPHPGIKSMSPAWQAYSLFVILRFSDHLGSLIIYIK